MPSEISTVKKRIRKTDHTCATGFPSLAAQLPCVYVYLNGVRLRALVDTGCSKSIVSCNAVKHVAVSTVNVIVRMMNGETTTCKGVVQAILNVNGKEVFVELLVNDVLPSFDILLGVDVIDQLGGCTFANGTVVFGADNVCCTLTPTLKVDDVDFSAEFSDGRWIVKWNWDPEEPTLKNTIAKYDARHDVGDEFNAEVEYWIQCGWLKPYDKEYDGIVPLMAVVQRNKKKVRPVLDYREVNQYISTHTGDSDVCSETLRSWRKMGENLKVVDLRKAYLQIHVHEDLWKYQVVMFNGKTYCLTRLGFGLNIAPRVMTKILRCVLASDKQVFSGTSSYIDDVIVNEDVVSAKRVISVLHSHGLQAKAADSLDGARVLGLRVSRLNGVMSWRRDNVIDAVEDVKTKRQVFSLCGQLVGHYPVAGQLRPACSYLKRVANDTK